MPYIERERRIPLAAGAPALSSGELTYQIQQLLKGFIEHHGDSYRTYAVCLGALEGAKLDLYVRKIEPYESKKIVDNGDVW